MKRIILLLSAALAVVIVSGCSKDSGKSIDDSSSIPTEIAEALEGETTEGILVGDVVKGDLPNKLLKINDRAIIQESVNPGMKMLKIELPLDDKNLPDGFFRQVKNIVDTCKLKSNADYDFFYFSTTKDDAVQIVASFKRVDDEFVLDTVAGVAPEYKDAADRAAKISSIFKKAE